MGNDVSETTVKGELNTIVEHYNRDTWYIKSLFSIYTFLPNKNFIQKILFS